MHQAKMSWQRKTRQKSGVSRPEQKMMGQNSGCRRFRAEIKAAMPGNVQAIIDGLLPEIDNDKAGVAEAFSEKARLIVAKAAGCKGYAKKLLDAPSKTVGYSAATNGLLTAEDAREAFLSSDTSRKMKKFLLQCDALESDKEVLEHAFELFGEKDKEMFWPLLARTKSEERLELLAKYLDEDQPMRSWLSSKHDEKVPGFPQMARRFPDLMVKLVTNGTLKWRWYWVPHVPPILQPVSTWQNFHDTLAHWGWRRKPDLMLQIIEELTTGKTTGAEGQFRSKGRGKGMVLMKGGRGRGGARPGGRPEDLPGLNEINLLANKVMDVHSTRYPLTMNKKIALATRHEASQPQFEMVHQQPAKLSLELRFTNEDKMNQRVISTESAVAKLNYLTKFQDLTGRQRGKNNFCSNFRNMLLLIQCYPSELTFSFALSP
eukprot:s1085_g9.t1